MLAAESQRIPDHAELVFNSQQIQRSLDQLADKLNQSFHNTDVIALCVMNGGLIFTGQLLLRLKFEVKVDYCHVTRYNNTTTGKTLQWLAKPHHTLKNKSVLILDDILDEGITLTHYLMHNVMRFIAINTDTTELSHSPAKRPSK